MVNLMKRSVFNSNIEAIDLSLMRSKFITISNCISARVDRGISNRESEGSGVFELELPKNNEE